MTRGALFLLLLVAGAAGAVGYVVGTGSVEPGTPSGPDDEARRRSTPVRRAAPAPDLSPEERRGLSQALASPVPEFETGTGTIEGHVRLPDGTPLEGVLVRATQERKRPSTYKRGRGLEDDADEDRLRIHIENLKHQQATRREAVTGPDGSYTLARLAETGYRFSAWREGYEIRPARRGAYVFRPGETVDLLAKPLALVSLEVLMPDGRPPERAKIQVRRGSGQSHQAWSPEDPEIGLEPGPQALRALVGDDEELASPEQDVTIDVGSPPRSLTFRLEERVGIRGRVAFPEGQEYHSGEVVALRLMPGKADDPERLVKEGLRKHVRSYPEPKFVFHDLSAGTYLLGLVLNRRDVVASLTVEVGKGMIEQDLAVPPPDPGDCIVVRVEAPDGGLVTDATFRTGYTGPKGSHSGGARHTANPDGTVLVPHHPVEKGHEDPGLIHFVAARTAAHGEKKVEYDRGGSGDLTIRFEEPATLEVTLTGYVGTEFEGSTFLNLRPGKAAGGGGYYGYGYSGRQNPLSPEGKQRFGPYQPGEYTLTVGLRSDQYRSATVATHLFALAPGPNRETVALPQLYSLTVIVEAKDGTTVYLQGQGGYSSQNGKVEDGRVVFDRLSAGEYRVSASGKRMTVKVPDQVEVKLESQEMNALVVSITNPEGAIASAGLQKGDVIIGIDDTFFEGQQQMWALMTLARTKEQVTLIVVRGNARHRIPVNFKAIYRGSGSGGHLGYTHHE